MNLLKRLGISEDAPTQNIFILRRKEDGVAIFISVKEMTPFETKDPESGFKIFNSKKEALDYKSTHGLNKKLFPVSLYNVNKYFKKVGIERAFFQGDELNEDSFIVGYVGHDGDFLCLSPHKKLGYQWQAVLEGAAIFTKKSANALIREMEITDQRVRTKAIPFKDARPVLDMSIIERFKYMGYYHLVNVKNDTEYFNSDNMNTENSEWVTLENANGFPKSLISQLEKLGEGELKAVKIE